jgi:hypothetical protein
MSKSQTLLRQMFQITLDIEVTLHTGDETTPNRHREQDYQALIQTLLAHPETLQQLLRSSAIAALVPAKQLLETEYNRGGMSEQDLLTPIMEQLDPEMRTSFTEEIEDQQNLYLFDALSAAVKDFRITASPLNTHPYQD